MTEQEWLASADPDAMLAFLASSPQYERRLRLFAAACARRMWARMDDLGRAAVEVAESFADGLVGPDVLRAARLACKGAGSQASWYAAATHPAIAARNAAHSALSQAPSLGDEALAQADLLRDIFGSAPFRSSTDAHLPVTNEALTLLARAAYEERDVDGTLHSARCHELAEMLAQGGLEELAAHCRSPGPHVRGCWVIDLLRCAEKDALGGTP